MNKEPLVIYWSPATYADDQVKDWELLYPQPKTLFSELLKNKDRDGNANDSYFSCPAVNDFTKKILVINSPMSCSYTFDKFGPGKENIFIQADSGNAIEINVARESTLNTGPTLVFALQYIFFSEESVQATFSAPYFQKAKYMEHGATIPGRFDIGQWFRPYHFEVQMWNNNGKFEIVEDEPLFYVHFETDRPIILKRFMYDKKLHDAAVACVDSTNLFGRGLTLLSRYHKFSNTGLRNKVLKMIKNNLID